MNLTDSGHAHFLRLATVDNLSVAALHRTWVQPVAPKYRLKHTHNLNTHILMMNTHTLMMNTHTLTMNTHSPSLSSESTQQLLLSDYNPGCQRFHFYSGNTSPGLFSCFSRRDYPGVTVLSPHVGGCGTVSGAALGAVSESIIPELSAIFKSQICYATASFGISCCCWWTEGRPAHGAALRKRGSDQICSR